MAVAAEPQAESVQVSPDLIRLLGDAWRASKRNPEGYASLAEVGQRAKAVSSFSVRNFGFSRLSDLVRSLPEFDVRSSDSGPLVKRMR